MKRKAQIEIAGLLIIVVLVSLVLMFVLTFNVADKENQGEPVKQVKESQIRDNFGPVLLETSTECDGKTIRELLADCGSVREIECPGPDTTSCAYVKTVIGEILKETLVKQGFAYIMSVKKGDSVIDTGNMYFENDCNPDGVSSVPSINPFETDYGTMKLVLVQCS